VIRFMLGYFYSCWKEGFFKKIMYHLAKEKHKEVSSFDG
jgi:hypothetical protein